MSEYGRGLSIYYKVVYCKRERHKRGWRLVAMGPDGYGYLYRVGQVAEPALPPDPPERGHCGSGIHVCTPYYISWWATMWEGWPLGWPRAVLEVEVERGDVIVWGADKVRCAKVRVRRVLTWAEVQKLLVDYHNGERVPPQHRVPRRRYASDRAVARLNEAAREAVG